jgi:lysyl-tRNA synthetase class 2
MRFTAVESTTLAVVACDEARELLQLEFCSRALYRYFGVPAKAHEGLLRAPSRGRYFNTEIRGRFRHARVAKAGEA